MKIIKKGNVYRKTAVLRNEEEIVKLKEKSGSEEIINV